MEEIIVVMYGCDSNTMQKLAESIRSRLTGKRVVALCGFGGIRYGIRDFSTELGIKCLPYRALDAEKWIDGGFAFSELMASYSDSCDVLILMPSDKSTYYILEYLEILPVLTKTSDPALNKTYADILARANTALDWTCENREVYFINPYNGISSQPP